MDCEIPRSRVTVSIFLELARLKIERLRHARKKDPEGGEWCLENLVGPLRKELGQPLPVNVSLLIDKADPRFSAAELRQQTALILREHCRACRACPLGRE